MPGGTDFLPLLIFITALVSQHHSMHLSPHLSDTAVDQRLGWQVLQRRYR